MFMSGSFVKIFKIFFNIYFPFKQSMILVISLCFAVATEAFYV